MMLDGKALKQLDNYLADVRGSLAGCVLVDAGDVERDIREHIERELEEVPQPVSCEELDKVLTNLGSPTQWVPEEERSGWRRMVHRLRRGPEDWRLAYLSFGLLILGLLLMQTPIDEFVPVCFLASFCLARAAVATVPDGKMLGGQKWLLYPALIPASLFIAFWVVVGPTVGLFCLADAVENGNFDVFPYNRHNDWAYWPIAFSFIAALTGLYWFILTLCQKTWPGLTRFLFRPFLDKPRPAAISAVMTLSLVLFAVCMAGGVLLLVFPGWYDWLEPIVQRPARIHRGRM